MYSPLIKRSTFFFSCTQDFKLRIFDVKRDRLVQKKEVQAFVGNFCRRALADHSRTMDHHRQGGFWPRLMRSDATLSNDNQWLAYSSITPMAFLTKSDPSDTFQFPLTFSEEDRFGVSAPSSGD